ncbi:MAG: methyltransferase domain-containing protein [Gammaproteobacteria bacterium]|nr:methyltransferase domain-containing protein [Gammaproteobacteria bacterium]
MTTPDSNELKERERKAWASVADGWKRRDELLTRGAAPVTQRMLELAGIARGHRTLDIASGVGEPSMSAARRVGETGMVVGTDLVDEMLNYAREKAAQAGLNNIEYHCVDGETLDFEPASFDAVTCRWGLMFMPEPENCLKLANNVMKGSARLAVACWAAPDKNPFVGVLMQTLGKYMEVPKPPPGTPGIFSLADPDRLKEVIAAAGFKNIELEELEIDVLEVDDGQAYWDAISDLAAPVMTLVNQLDEAARSAYISDVIQAANALKQGATLRMRGTTWLASAGK